MHIHLETHKHKEEGIKGFAGVKVRLTVKGLGLRASSIKHTE